MLSCLKIHLEDLIHELKDENDKRAGILWDVLLYVIGWSLDKVEDAVSVCL